MFEIDGSLIVGINKTKIPQFTSLIEVGHSRKTIQHPVQGNVSLKFQKSLRKESPRLGSSMAWRNLTTARS
jgi:hypothetical protein